MQYFSPSEAPSRPPRYSPARYVGCEVGSGAQRESKVLSTKLKAARVAIAVNPVANAEVGTDGPELGPVTTRELAPIAKPTPAAAPTTIQGWSSVKRLACSVAFSSEDDGDAVAEASGFLSFSASGGV